MANQTGSPLSSRFHRWKGWLPTRGNVVFTIVLVICLFFTQKAGVMGMPGTDTSGAATGLIPYQGRLADINGNPLTGTYNLEFRLYNSPETGIPLWEELWTGSNSVQVSDGLFNVMLGSLTPISQDVITANSNLYLGITVNTDSEMMPRIQLGTVPFAVQAKTVSDASITTEKIASGAVTNTQIANGSITVDKFAPGLTLIPVGTIVMWSGAIDQIPSGWALCDGNNGTPDLRGRFLVGAGDAYVVGETGGQDSITLAIDQLPAHAHSGTTTQSAGSEFSQSTSHGGGDVNYGMGTITYSNNKRLGAHAHPFTTDSTGNGQPVENRPAYFALAYIMKTS